MTPTEQDEMAELLAKVADRMVAIVVLKILWWLGCFAVGCWVLTHLQWVK